MKSNYLTQCVLIASLPFAMSIAQANAEEIKVPVGQQSAELNNIDRPKAGMSRAKVIEQFGQPLKENAARGKPPISSSEYEKFVVYFETDTVIHTVLKPTQHEAKEVHTEEEVEMPESSLKPKANTENKN